METVEGNKIIADFMGNRVLYSDGANDYYINPVLAQRTHYLAYHKNWGWLMPVIEKISQHHYGWDKKENEWDDTAYPRTFGMRDSEGNYMVRLNAQQLFSAPTLIEAAWQAVISHIEYVNSQTPNNE